MRVNLDTPNPALPEETQAEVAVNNNKAIAQAINKTGVNFLLDKNSNTAQTTTAATYTKLANWDGVFTSSGGFIELEFISSVQADKVCTLSVKMIVDADPNKTRICNVVFSSASTELFVGVKYREALGAGRHKVEIYTAVDNGAIITFSAIAGAPSNATTELTVVETLL